MGYKYEDTGYLVIRQDRYRRAVIDRLTKKAPALESGEIAVKVRLCIDSDLFKKFLPEVVVEINEPDIIQPTVEVIENFEAGQ
jgi:hypothetical protein